MTSIPKLGSSSRSGSCGGFSLTQVTQISTLCGFVMVKHYVVKDAPPLVLTLAAVIAAVEIDVCLQIYRRDPHECQTRFYDLLGRYLRSLAVCDAQDNGFPTATFHDVMTKNSLLVDSLESSLPRYRSSSSSLSLVQTRCL